MFDPFLPLLLLLAVVAFLALLDAQRRARLASGSATKRRGILAVLWLLFAGCLVYFAWPLLFLGPDDPKTSMYVQIPAGQKAGAFNDRLAVILTEQGLESSAASISVPDDPQDPMYVLEARSALVRVWSQTMPLSPDEAVACGYILQKNDFGANDQRQYKVAVDAVPFFSGRAETTFGAIKAELLRSGFGVSPRPSACQPITQIAGPAKR